MSNTDTRGVGNLGALGQAFLAATDIAEFLEIWLSNDLLDHELTQVFSIYYASYLKSFTPRMRGFYGGQIREVEDVLVQKPGASILEVGCGLGTETLWLALRGAKVSAIDMRQDRVNTAQARQSVLEREIGCAVTCTFDLGTFLDFDEREPFDIIWMEQAFHHLEPRRNVVRKTSDLLKPGGHLIISEANALNPLLQLELFLRRGIPRVATQEGPDGKHHPYGVERVTTASALTRMFEQVGVQRVSVRHFRMFPNKPVFDHFAGIEDRLATNALAPLLTHFNYVGRKAA